MPFAGLNLCWMPSFIVVISGERGQSWIKKAGMTRVSHFELRISRFLYLLRICRMSWVCTAVLELDWNIPDASEMAWHLAGLAGLQALQGMFGTPRGVPSRWTDRIEASQHSLPAGKDC